MKTEEIYWYKEIEGVTSAPSNDKFGIRDIQVFEPTEEQKEEGNMVAVVVVKLDLLSVRLTVHHSVAYPNALYLRVPQTKEKKDDSVFFHDEVKLNRELKAQVLYHIHSLVVEA